MLLRRETLAGIEQGTITLVFRRWRKPTVRTGGTLMTGAGKLHIRSVQPIDPAGITPVDAERAGYVSRDALLNELTRWEGQLYRIELGSLEPDPRVALRAATALEPELESVFRRLEGMDVKSPSGPWTRQTLELIQDRPEVRSRDLCEVLGQDRTLFKQNVRKLKALGLTESLPVGYRLSPRGDCVLNAMRGAPTSRRSKGGDRAGTDVRSSSITMREPDQSGQSVDASMERHEPDRFVA